MRLVVLQRLNNPICRFYAVPKGHSHEMKRKQSGEGIDLGSLISFPTRITVNAKRASLSCLVDREMIVGWLCFMEYQPMLVI